MEMESLFKSITLLRISHESSKTLDSAIDQTSSRLKAIQQRLPSLESGITTVAQSFSLLPIKRHLEFVIGPAFSAVRVFELVRGLERTLEEIHPHQDLFRFVSLIKQLEDALRFLTSNSKLVLHGLEDLLQLLDDVEDGSYNRYIRDVRKGLRILIHLQGIEKVSRGNGGGLFSALQKLEAEFEILLLENEFVTEKLHFIVDRMSANDLLDNIKSIYVKVRSSNVKSAMDALDLDYLAESESVQIVEDEVDRWSKNLEFCIKRIYEVEYRVCKSVFEKEGEDVCTDCIAIIILRSGRIQSFLKFAEGVTKGKKDAIKLLKLIEVFGTLYTLRSDFNRLFVGKHCVEIRNQIRDLVKNVVDSACKIFNELSTQVKLQRKSHPPPPLDGSIPELVTVVTDFCNQLLENSYRVTMIQILEINNRWNGLLQCSDAATMFLDEIRKVVTVLEENMEVWTAYYEELDMEMSDLFAMNGHDQLLKNCSGTKVGDVMGDAWLRSHEQAFDFLSQKWGKMASNLSTGDQDQKIQLETDPNCKTLRTRRR